MKGFVSVAAAATVCEALACRDLVDQDLTVILDVAWYRWGSTVWRMIGDSYGPPTGRRYEDAYKKLKVGSGSSSIFRLDTQKLV